MAGPDALTLVDRPVPGGTDSRAFASGPAGRDEAVMPFLAGRIRAGTTCTGMVHDHPGDIDPREFTRRPG